MIDGRMDVPARSGPASAGYVQGTAVIRLSSPSRKGLCDGPGWRRTHIAPAGEMFQLALSRAAGECAALGGDGIVGVTVHARPFPAGGTEFTVQGTAVRARTAVRPAAPFTAHVSGQEFAALLRAGWVPAALAVGICAGTRHDDRRRRSGLGNREMPGYTGLVSDTRGVARTRLMHAAMSQGAEGVVVGEMSLRISERPCQTYERRHDRAAEVTVVGTSIVSFGRSPVTADRPPLTMMRLNPAAEIARFSPLRRRHDHLPRRRRRVSLALACGAVWAEFRKQVDGQADAANQRIVDALGAEDDEEAGEQAP